MVGSCWLGAYTRSRVPLVRHEPSSVVNGLCPVRVEQLHDVEFALARKVEKRGQRPFKILNVNVSKCPTGWRRRGSLCGTAWHAWRVDTGMTRGDEATPNLYLVEVSSGSIVSMISVLGEHCSASIWCVKDRGGLME